MSLLCISGYSPIGHVIGLLQLSSEQHDIVSESSQSEEQEAIAFVGSVKSSYQFFKISFFYVLFYLRRVILFT